MKRALIFILLLTGCCTAFAAEPDLILTPDGLGPVKLGMSEKELQVVLREKLEYDYDPFVHHACGTVSTKRSQALGISYTLESARVTRISIDFFDKEPRSPVRTEAGIAPDAVFRGVRQRRMPPVCKFNLVWYCFTRCFDHIKSRDYWIPASAGMTTKMQLRHSIK